MWNTLFPHSQFDTPLFNGNELPFLMKRPATNLGQTVENLLLMEGYRYAPPSGWHAHASLGPRAKEEAALGGRCSEGTLRAVRVVVLDRGQRTGLFFRVAGCRAIRAALARGQPPVLVWFEPDLRYKGFKLGHFVGGEELRDLHLRRLLALELAVVVGHGLKRDVLAVLIVCCGEDRMQPAARLPVRAGAARHLYSVGASVRVHSGGRQRL